MAKLETAKTAHSNADIHYSSISDGDFALLLFNLKNEGGSALHRIIPPFNEEMIPEQIKTPMPCRLTKLFDPMLTRATLKYVQEVCENQLHQYAVSAEQIVVIEKLTRKQFKSRLWNDIREGRITGSSIHAVTRTTLHSPSKTLI